MILIFFSDEILKFPPEERSTLGRRRRRGRDKAAAAGLSQGGA